MTEKDLSVEVEAPKDIHKETAAQVFNVPPEQVTEEQRRAAKRINYFGLYSGYSGKEEDNSGVFFDLD
jgi:DNA polymerase-1